MNKYYRSFKELQQHNTCGTDYRIEIQTLFPKRIFIVAPHGGTIEPGTSEITKKIADNNFNYYCFESLRDYGSDYISLHITSHLFDEPECIRWSRQHKWVASIHGCNVESKKVFLGGLNQDLIDNVKKSLEKNCFLVEDKNHKYRGVHPQNICNIGKNKSGLQIELSIPLRQPDMIESVSLSISAGLQNFLTVVSSND